MGILIYMIDLIGTVKTILNRRKLDENNNILHNDIKISPTPILIKKNLKSNYINTINNFEQYDSWLPITDCWTVQIIEK